MKLRRFCTAKHTISCTKKEPTEWENSFTVYTSDSGLIAKVHKEFNKLDIKKTNISINKWHTHLNREFPIENTQMAIKHLKRWLPSIPIKEI